MAYSVMDATFGLGMTVGPVIGVFLYNIGGFLTPFLVCGVAATVTGVLCVWKCVPRETSDKETTKEKEESSTSILPVLHNPRALVSLLSVTTASISVGFEEALLTLYLDIFSLSVFNIGLCFLLTAVIYTLGNTLVHDSDWQHFLLCTEVKEMLYKIAIRITVINIKCSPSVSLIWLCC